MKKIITAFMVMIGAMVALVVPVVPAQAAVSAATSGSMTYDNYGENYYLNYTVTYWAYSDGTIDVTNVRVWTPRLDTGQCDRFYDIDFKLTNSGTTYWSRSNQTLTMSDMSKNWTVDVARRGAYGFTIAGTAGLIWAQDERHSEYILIG